MNPDTPINRDPIVERRVERALQLIDASRFKQAEGLLQSLAWKHQDQPAIPYGFGLFHTIREDFQAAITFLKEAVQLDPSWPEAWYNLGISYRRTYEVGEALACAMKVVELGEAGDSFVIESQKLLDDFTQTIQESYGLTLQQYVDNARTFNTAFAHLEQGQIHDAIAGFESVLQLEPASHQSHGNLALCHAHLGGKETALHHIDRALEIDPTYEVARNNRNLIAKLKDGEKLDLPMQTVSYGATGMKPV